MNPVFGKLFDNLKIWSSCSAAVLILYLYENHDLAVARSSSSCSESGLCCEWHLNV